MADDRDVFQKSFKGLLEQALRADDWAEDQAQTLPAQILQNSIPEVADFMLKQPKKERATHAARTQGVRCRVRAGALETVKKRAFPKRRQSRRRGRKREPRRQRGRANSRCYARALA